MELQELVAGDRIEWADSDAGQGEFWRVVTVTYAGPMRGRLGAVGRWAITVENDAGVRTSRAFRLATTTYTKVTAG